MNAKAPVDVILKAEMSALIALATYKKRPEGSTATAKGEDPGELMLSIRESTPFSLMLKTEIASPLFSAVNRNLPFLSTAIEVAPFPVATGTPMEVSDPFLLKA
jgi:hypothetical protein